MAETQKMNFWKLFKSKFKIHCLDITKGVQISKGRRIMMCIRCNMMVVAKDIRLNSSKFQSKGPYTGHFSYSSIVFMAKKALLSCKY